MTDSRSTRRTESYRIECLDCGAVEYGATEAELEWDKQYHRDHHCPEADFEVSPL